AKRKLVLDIRVKGNQAISSATILAKIKTKPGTPFSQEVVNDDIKRLYALGYFTDVAVDVEDYKEGVMVTVIVEEKPVIEEIVFEGNKKIRDRRLKKIMQLKAGDMLSFSKLSEDISEIRSFYERSGFHRVKVKYELEKDKELNQVTINIKIDERSRIRIKRVRVEGNESVKTKKILELMQTRPAWLLRRGYFDDETFENDLAKIKMYYQDLGFLDISITPQFDYEEEKGVMYITLKIDEGKCYYVGKIFIEGNIVFPEEEIREKLSLKPGDPFSYTKLRQDMEGVRALYYHKGYMNAEISVDRVLEPKTQNLDIIFGIDAKDVVYIGKINIKGNTKTKDVVIRRELRAYPGERFDGDKIRRSKERLYNLGFFEDIYFETERTDSPDVNNLEVSVKETKTGEFAFGGGYSSVDEFIGFVQLSQKNFDILNFPYFTGDGQYLALKADLSTVRWDADISWTEPWILDYPLSFGFDGYHRTHLRRTQVGYGYKEARTGGDLRFGKEFLEYFNGNLMYKLEHVDISDVSAEASQDLRDEAGKNWLSSLMLGVNFDNRDNVFSPTKGFNTGLSLENTGGFLLGDKNFLKGFAYGSFYYSPFAKIVLELKARAGLCDSYGRSKKVPIYERFYAGGANTIRGYRERKVGPRDVSSNDPLGGESLLVGNVEVTFPIYEKVIKGAVFYDVGNVWEEVRDFARGNFKQGAGIGVRVKTPIGPVKLDWGYPLSRNHDDKRQGEFYFSVSHGF
ncbi:MAG: outer membrane protein assembly factor BamA, partial [Candidatus Omnitrophota bacterium]